MVEGQRDRERENAKQALSWESPIWELDPTNWEIMTWAETKSLMHHWLSSPGVPQGRLLRKPNIWAVWDDEYKYVDKGEDKRAFLVEYNDILSKIRMEHHPEVEDFWDIYLLTW